MNRNVTKWNVKRNTHKIPDPSADLRIPKEAYFYSLHVIWCALLMWVLLLLVVMVVVWCWWWWLFRVRRCCYYDFAFELFTMRSKSKWRCATYVSSCTSMKVNILPLIIPLIPYTCLLWLMCMSLAVSVYSVCVCVFVCMQNKLQKDGQQNKMNK